MQGVSRAFQAHMDRTVELRSKLSLTLTTIEIERLRDSLRKFEKTWIGPLSASTSSSSSSSVSSSSKTKTSKSKSKSKSKPSPAGSVPTTDYSRRIPETELFSVILQMDRLCGLIEIGQLAADDEMRVIVTRINGGVGESSEVDEDQDLIGKMHRLLMVKQLCADAQA